MYVLESEGLSVQQLAVRWVGVAAPVSSGSWPRCFTGPGLLSLPSSSLLTLPTPNLLSSSSSLSSLTP